jgi:hypothetical protein
MRSSAPPWKPPDADQAGAGVRSSAHRAMKKGGGNESRRPEGVVELPDQNFFETVMKKRRPIMS